MENGFYCSVCDERKAARDIIEETEGGQLLRICKNCGADDVRPAAWPAETAAAPTSASPAVVAPPAAALAPNPRLPTAAAGGAALPAFVQQVLQGLQRFPAMQFQPLGNIQIMGDFATSEGFQTILNQMFESQGTARSPIDAHVLSQVPLFQFTRPDDVDMDFPLSADEDDCSICQEEYARGDWLYILPCNHTFHRACVESWFREHNTCPMCRFSMTPEHIAEYQKAHPSNPSSRTYNFSSPSHREFL